MNGILVTLSPAEFVDRFLICSLKADKLRTAERARDSQVNDWLQRHEGEFLTIVAASPEIWRAAEGLRILHAQLWLLEDEVRKPTLADFEFIAAARQIFALNTERHGLKADIDRLLGKFSFGDRVYGGGA